MIPRARHGGRRPRRPSRGPCLTEVGAKGGARALGQVVGLRSRGAPSGAVDWRWAPGPPQAEQQSVVLPWGGWGLRGGHGTVGARLLPSPCGSPPPQFRHWRGARVSGSVSEAKGRLGGPGTWAGGVAPSAFRVEGATSTCSRWPPGPGHPGSERTIFNRDGLCKGTWPVACPWESKVKGRGSQNVLWEDPSPRAQQLLTA